MLKMIDVPARSFLKALSWRGIGLFFLTTITFLVTNSTQTTTIIALTYHVGMIFAFVLHERAWTRISWGRSKGLFIQMTGMSGAGKSTIAQKVAHKLRKKGINVEVIDGDEYRTGLCNDLGFSKKDRNTNIRRLGFVSKILARNNVISIIAAINPYDSIRQNLKALGPNVKLIYVKCNLGELKLRDPKGLYVRADLPDDDPAKVHNFTGISDPYEIPIHPDLIIETDKENMYESARKLEKYILNCIS